MAFQGFDELASGNDKNPFVFRARFVNQIYVCFLYLRPSFFDLLRAEVPQGSTTAKCCEFLVSHPLRAFRDAVAHGEWRYTRDFSALDYWADDEPESTGPLVRHRVSNQEFNFWTILARCTTYVSFTTLRGHDRMARSKP